MNGAPPVGNSANPKVWFTFALTGAALLCFAANSILCRFALGRALIDPVAYTQVRLLAGALVLVPLLLRVERLSIWPPSRMALREALALFVYAIGFSLAYVRVGAGTGALILFALVQMTMIGIGIVGGLRPTIREWMGLSLAGGGLIYLMAPGVAAPSWSGGLLMAAAGIAWGIYSLLGRREPDPFIATARNFLFCAPLALVSFALTPNWSESSATGIELAAASGALTSALGYIVWYKALPRLTPFQGAIIQVASPILVALGGIAFLSEDLTWRLALSAMLILGGIMLSLKIKR